METIWSPILALGLFFGTLSAQAAPAGLPQEYGLRTKYFCRVNDVIVHNKHIVVGLGQGVDEINFVADPGANQSLTFGNNRNYMIWPRVANGTFNKSLEVLARDKSGTYKIIQEVDMGDAQKTKSNISLITKDQLGEDRPVSCQIEMEWIKKAK